MSNDTGTTIAKTGQYIQFTTEQDGKGDALTVYDATKAKGMNYVNDIADATVLVSGSDGTFSVQGLMYAGTNAYSMVETKAPSGYAIVNKETPFTINAGSWGTSSDELAVKIANKPSGFFLSYCQNAK